MPTLPQQYIAPAVDRPATGGRRATAEDFGASIGTVGKDLQEFQRKLAADAEEDEARKALVGSSQVRAESAQKVADAEKSGAELEPIKKEMLDKLAKIGENFVTKKGASAVQLYTANSILMFDETANRIGTQRAYSGATQQAQNFMKSEGALIVQSPSYLKIAEANAKAFVDMFPNVSPQKRTEIVNHMVDGYNITAAREAVLLNPTEAKAKLENGEWALDPVKRLDLIDYAKNKVQESDAIKRQQNAEFAKTEVAKVSATEMKYEQQIHDGKFDYQAFKRDPAFDPAMQATPEGVDHSRAASSR